MSLASWYHYKADQSAVLAKAAITPEHSADFAIDEKFWRAMAVKLDIEDGFGKAPNWWSL